MVQEPNRVTSSGFVKPLLHSWMMFVDLFLGLGFEAQQLSTLRSSAVADLCCWIPVGSFVLLCFRSAWFCSLLLTRLPPAAADPRRIKGKVTRTGPETRPQTQGPLIRSSTTTNKD